MTEAKSTANAAPPPDHPSAGSAESKPSMYPNVHRMRSGRWQAWTNCMSTPGSSRGPYVGVHDTEKLAARAQDRSLLKHRALATKPVKLNFPEADYASDEKFRKALTNEEFLKLLAVEARACYRKVEPTKCFEKFLAEEKSQGTLPIDQTNSKGKYKVIPLREFLKQILMSRPDEEEGGEEAADNETSKPDPPAEVGTVDIPAPILVTNPAAELTWVGKRARSVRK